MTKSKRPRVHGDRICIRCKGICHEGSLRKKIPKSLRYRGGMRSHYFCSKRCFEIAQEQDLEKHFRKSGIRLTDEFFKTPEWRKTIKERLERYEYVDVITA